MVTWLKRWTAYFLISAGLVLLLLPLNIHRMVTLEKDFIFLKTTGKIIPQERLTIQPASPAAPISIVIQKDTLSHYPFILDGVNTLQRISMGEDIQSIRLDNFSLAEW